MYANVFTAEKLSAFHQAQLVRDLERRRSMAAHTRATAGGREPAPAARHTRWLVPRFGMFRLRPA